MHNRNTFKYFFFSMLKTEVKEDIQDRYDKEVKAFRKKYNEMHPDAKIWVHAYNDKGTRWIVKGDFVFFYIRVVRFIISAGPEKGKTFTFLGSMFVSGSRFSKQYILTALCNGEEGALAKAGTSCATLHKWNKALSRTCAGFEELLLMTYQSVFFESMCRTEEDLIIEICSVIFLTFEGRFPLWKLH